MQRRTVLLVPVVLLAVFEAVSQVQNDQVILQCASSCPVGANNGVLLIAKTTVRAQDADSSSLQFGRIDEAYKQVIAFQKGRAPAYKRADNMWTSSSDSVPLTYTARYRLPVRIWAICPDPAGDCNKPLTSSAKTYLTNFRVKANAVLNTERVGIRLVKPAAGDMVTDETQTSDNPKEFADFSAALCPAFLAKVLPAPPASPGKMLAGAVNLYVVHTVDGNPARGVNCSGGANQWAVVGSTADWATMLHEVGHSLTLEHVDEWNSYTWGDPVFGPSDPHDNFMHSGSDTRKFFTEGQTFRGHFHFNSALNLLLSTQAEAEQRYCDYADPKKIEQPCPKLDMRIWPDW